MQAYAGKRRPKLLFVSPRFLLPADSGGKIRTTQILRGLKELGEFEVTLCAPASKEEQRLFADELGALCDEFVGWKPTRREGAISNFLWQLRRISYLVNSLPIPVRSDRTRVARATVIDALAPAPDIVVFDFLHSAVLAPLDIPCPSLLFTHNVEAEIFRRHLEVADGRLQRWLWRNQHRKMVAFESRTTRMFDEVVAVSDRDAETFRSQFQVEHVHVIPTGLDVDRFAYTEPADSSEVVFCGSMDWLANRDGVEFFLDEVWGRVADAVPQASMTVIGRAPPADLVRKAKQAGVRWHFTGFVDDVRAHLQNSAVSVIPLRVGGGTRLKVYEAMAIGSAIVSTSLGVEGLALVDGEHYRRADRAESMADAVVALLSDYTLRQTQTRNARRYVEEHCSYINAARAFQEGCINTIARRLRA